MRDLTAFNQRLQLTFGSDWRARWDAPSRRWAIDSLSAAGQPITQLWGWFQDQQGEPIEPDPETGLHPYRDLDDTAQEEIIRNLHRSNIGRSGYGALDWERSFQAVREHNVGLARQQRQRRASAWADLVQSVDIRRPGWLKDHGRQKVRA